MMVRNNACARTISAGVTRENGQKTTVLRFSFIEIKESHGADDEPKNRKTESE
jgi:hypothetical protein